MAAESKLEKYTAGQVGYYGGEFIKVRWVGRRGCPDRLLWLPWMDGPVWIEFKAPNGHLKLYQKREHRRLRKMGQAVFVWYNKPQVDTFIRESKDAARKTGIYSPTLSTPSDRFYPEHAAGDVDGGCRDGEDGIGADGARHAVAVGV